MSDIDRKAWECPRCKTVNAPHADRCACAPAVAAKPAPLPERLKILPLPAEPVRWPPRRLDDDDPPYWRPTDVQFTIHSSTQRIA